jgi:hypothetical protein
MSSHRKKPYKEPTIRYPAPDCGYAINGERRDSRSLEKSRRKLYLFRIIDPRITMRIAILNLLQDRNRLGDSLSLACGNITKQQFDTLHSGKQLETDQDRITSQAMHLSELAQLDAEEMSVMIGCNLEQAEKAIQELTTLEI